MKLTEHIRLLFHKEKEPFLRLHKILGFLPHDLSLYRTALMHKSMHKVQDSTGRFIHNERLEFLGDAILGAVVADILYFRYPNQQEGFLTTLRSKLVRRDMLNKLAVQIGLDKLVLHDERMSTAHNNYMNGNAFEAFIGAIYLDRGYSYCMRFMSEVVLEKFVNIDELSQKDENYKSKLIEWCQRYQFRPTFEIVSQKILPDRNTPIFVARILIDGAYSGQGEGFSKKEAHQKAASQALKKIRRDQAFVNHLMEARHIFSQTPQEKP